MLTGSNLQWIWLIAAASGSGAFSLLTGVVVGAGAVLLLAPQARQEAWQSLQSLLRAERQP